MLKTLGKLFCLPLLVALLLSFPVHAQNTIGVPGDAKFVLQIDLQSLRKSKVGATLFDMAKKAALEEMGKNGQKGEMSFDKIKDVVGFDPFEEVQGIVICASDFENPEKSMLGMLRLKRNTGNIEGLLLSIPGYEKSDHGKYEIHTATPSDDVKLYGAIHKNSAGMNTVIVGAQKNAVTNLLDSLDSSPSDSNKSLRTVGLESDRKVIASIQVLELPSSKELGQGPQANIAALLNSLSLSIVEEDEELEVRGAMQANTEKQADKIRQSIQGLAAIVEFATSFEEDPDEELKQVIAFLKQVKVTQEGTSVRVNLRLPTEQIAGMIKEMSK